MTKLADNVVGKIKEVIAEVMGNEKLRKEGEKQRNKPDRSEPLETPKSLPE